VASHLLNNWPLTVLLAIAAGIVVQRAAAHYGRFPSDLLAFVGSRSAARQPRVERTAPQAADGLSSKYASKRQKIFHTLSMDLRRLLPNGLEVRHLMTTNVTTALPSTPVRQLSQQFKDLEIRHILICDEIGVLFGLVSDRDMQSRSRGTAADVMTSDLIVVAPNTLVRTAITMMLEHHVSSLPVVAEGCLVGILTTTDMLMTLQCSLQLVETLVKDVFPQVSTEPAEPAELECAV
jgi:CBS-domain-containing membrane protein